MVWADAFAEMRLEEEQSEREPFDARDLQTIFDAPLFTEHKPPVGAKGDAGVWLPLLALFAGARQAEYAGLRVSDIRSDEDTSVLLMWFTRDIKAGRRLKTKTSERVVPVHPQLVTLGFLKYVEARRKEGDKAWLFPTVAPDQKGALSAWSKWWGRYLRHLFVRPGKVLQGALRYEVVSSSCHRAIPISAGLDCQVSRKSQSSPSTQLSADSFPFTMPQSNVSQPRFFFPYLRSIRRAAFRAVAKMVF